MALQSAIQRLPSGGSAASCVAGAAHAAQPHSKESTRMLDTLFVAATVVFFAAAFGYSWACDRV